MARLRIHFAGTQTVVSLRGAETTVGRSNRCTIRLPDKRLAEVHFRIQEKSRGYRLKDDGSGLGTKVNGKNVYATTLRHGDEISAGGLRCVFLSERAVPVAPPADGVDAQYDESDETAPSRQKTNVGQLLLLVGAGVVALGVAGFLVLRTPPDQIAADLWKQARQTLAEARAEPATAREKLQEAADLLGRIFKEYRQTSVAGTAAIKLTEVRNVLRALSRVDAERKLADSGELDDEATLELRGRLGQLKLGGHPTVLREIDRIELDIQQRRTERLERRYAQAERKSRDHFVNERYSQAADTWRDLDMADYFMAKRVDSALADVLKRTSAEYRARLRLAGRDTDLDARIGLLEACRKIFSGTRHADDLQVRISALRARPMRRAGGTLDQRPPKTKKKRIHCNEPPYSPMSRISSRKKTRLPTSAMISTGLMARAT